MALNVNINVASLTAQRNLGRSGMALSTTLERLSSGLRINKAGDDAAGLSISNSLAAQARGLNQAIRNGGDGLSMLGTAESAIAEQTSLVQRMRELAVQASTDTNSAASRSALDSEATQLINEFERIARTTEFNGVKLLDGSFTTKDLHVGAFATADDKISVSFSSTKSADTGTAYKLTTSTAVSGTLTQGEASITVNGTAHSIGTAVSDGVSSDAATGSALAYANIINAKSTDTGVKATASTSHTGGAVQAAGSTDAATNTLKINGVLIDGATIAAATDTTLRDVINAKSGETGVTAEVSSSKLVLTAADGRNIQVELAGTAGTTTGLTAGTYRGTLELSSAESFSLANAADELGFGASATAAEDANGNVAGIDLTTKANAESAIDVLDTALAELNSTRSSIGALTNRLNSAITNLTAAAENASAANSRILDADFAAETAALTRGQILQQAGVAVLSQANQVPQIALSLLR